MKRTLLSVLAAAFVLGTYALTPDKVSEIPSAKADVVSIDFPVDLTKCTPSYAEGEQGVVFSLSGEPSTAVGFNGGSMGKKVAMAFEMTPELTTLYAGKKITHINFYTGTNKNSNTNKLVDVNVFIAEGTGNPIVSQRVDVDDTPFKYYSVELEEPFTIEAGKDLMIGSFSILRTASDYAIVVDQGSYLTNIGNYACQVAKKATPFRWQHLPDTYGFVCVSVTLEGDNFPENDIEVQKVKVPTTVKANEKFNADIYMVNKGANEISTLDVEYTIGDAEPVAQTIELTKAAIMGQTVRFTVKNLVCNTPGAHAVSVKVVKINGEDVSSKNFQNSASVILFGAGDGYTRNVVIEEFTGTWCGYCPVGIISMEFIRDNFTDGTFIPVAIHTGDEMDSDSYAPVLSNFSTGSVPGSTINRKLIDVYPYPAASLVALYNQLRAQPSFVDVSLECGFTDESKKAIVFQGYTKYFYDIVKPGFILSFAITEDGVGPYNQTNYYNGSGQNLEGWESAGSPVSTIYNDVARQLDTYEGIGGTVPQQAVAGQEYSFWYEMELPKGVNPDKLNCIVYVINTDTGEIETAATVKAGTTGVSDAIVNTDKNAPVEYFNLQGMRVENPSNGIYIRRQGAEVTKVVIK